MDENFQNVLKDQVKQILIDEVIEEMLLEYRLKNIPGQDSLYDCLEAYTKSNLIQLAQKNGIEIRTSWNKGPIIEALYTGIMDTMTERLLILGDDYVELFHQFAVGEFHSDEVSFEKFAFFLEVYPLAAHMGLIYSFDAKNDVTIIIPLEVKMAVAYFASKSGQIKKEYRKQITTIKQIQDALLAAVHLYGVVSSNRVRDLWEIQYPNREFSKDFDVFFWTMIPLIAMKHDHFFINYRLIANYRLAEPEYALDFYHHLFEKMGGDYYVPSKNEIRYYAEHPFNQHSSDYKKMEHLVSKFTPDIDSLLEFIESNILLGDSLSALMEQIQAFDLLLFESDEQLYEFAELYTKLHNNARLWENGGYTPSELFNRLADNPFNLPENPQSSGNVIPLADYQPPADRAGQPQVTKKVGRNDPCPCGSGKKYKKCCWNK